MGLSYYEWRQEEVWDALGAHGPGELVCESFQYRQAQSNADLSGVEVIGLVKEWSRQFSIPISFQSPAEGKFYWTDEKLKRIGLYTPGKRHSRDATRHLLYYAKVFA